jgi:hypothetical protein
MPRRAGTSREFCDCGSPVEVGKGETAICGRCHRIEQWWKLEQERISPLKVEGQREWAAEGS